MVYYNLTRNSDIINNVLRKSEKSRRYIKENNFFANFQKKY